MMTEVATSPLSDYEKERNKPMPNRIHGKIQLKLSAQLDANYGNQFDCASEVTLDSTPPSTPDISIFSKDEPLDWQTIQAKEQEVPITIIEIISPSQSIDQLAKKVYDIYFPLGVKSAWLVLPPPFKSVYVITPDGQQHFSEADAHLLDQTTNIEIDLGKVFEGLK